MSTQASSVAASASGESVPIAGTRVKMFRRFGAMMSNSSADEGGGNGADAVGSVGGAVEVSVGLNGASRLNSPSSAGYVEFGMSEADRTGRTLGTFAGVFCPVALSMFSALLFIRVGFLVGNAGLYVTLMQFMIAYLILVFTVMSVCAISTNGAVEGGGVYFMISRTLGPEFGGAIGTLFFLANIVGCALAITGFTEGIVQNLGPGGYFGGPLGLIPDGWWWRFLYCTLVNTLMLVVCLVGASLFAKMSVLTLGIVCVCLLSTFLSFAAHGPMAVPIPADNRLVRNETAANSTDTPVFGNYTGWSRDTLNANLFPHYGPDYTQHDSTQPVNFAIVFGVLFSGVTGIMAGANMSGELRRPSRSIPLGTLSAVAFTFGIYQLLAVCIAATSTNFLLRNNFLFLMPVNVIPAAVACGILTATFSTGLSNLIGASRVLEALAKDRVYGQWLAPVQTGTWHGNPITAVLCSWLLVEVILLIGSLNLIAQINSILFMLAYFATNLACLGIECTGAPNFRPTFKYFTWHTCVLGLAGTLIMMFVINAVYAAVSIIWCLVLVIGLHVLSPASQGTQWGSISQALMFHQVRKYLLMLDSRKDHVKFWRPQMLLLVASPRSCCPLIDFVNDLKKGGLYVLGHVKRGDFAASGGGEDPAMGEYVEWMALIDHMRVKAFAEVTMAPSIREGVQHLIRIAGMGAMKPNTIVLGYYDDQMGRDFFEADSSPYATTAASAPELRRFAMRRTGEEKQLSAGEYVAIVCDVLRMKKNLCLCRHFGRLDKQAVQRSNHCKYLDVWPVNVFEPSNEDPFDVVSLFMLQLACIINMLPAWKRLHLRVFLCETGDEAGGGGAGSSLRSSNFSVNTVATDRPAEYKLRELLKLLRIGASIHQIDDWSGNEEFRRQAAVMRHYTSRRGGVVGGGGGAGGEQGRAAAEFQEDAPLAERNMNRSKMYMQRVNEIIRDRSDATAATFIYLPAPPRIDSPHWAQTSEQYLDLLTELTADLPPTVLVHGVSAVTSINL